MSEMPVVNAESTDVQSPSVEPSDAGAKSSFRVSMEALAAGASLVGILLPISGAIQRTLAFWASGRVPPGLGPAVSIQQLAILGAPASVAAAIAMLVAVGLALVVVRARSDVGRESASELHRSALGRATVRLVRRLDAPAKAPVLGPPVPYAIRHPRIGAVIARIPPGPSVPARVQGWLWIAFGAALIVGFLFLPTWVALLLIALTGYGIAAVYLVAAWRQPVLADLLAWALFVTLLTGVSAGLAPRPELAPTVLVRFRSDALLLDGKYSYIGNTDTTYDLLECSPSSSVVEVNADRIQDITFVAQAKLPWSDEDDWSWIFPWDPRYTDLWTPLWKALFQEEPWRLGYLQQC